MRVFHVIAFFVIAEMMVSAQTSLTAPPGGYRQSYTTAGAASLSTGEDTLFQVQNESDVPNSSAPETQDPPSMFNHSDSSPFWISGQTNIIFQAHPPFHAAYSGPNSLSNAGEYKTSC